MPSRKPFMISAGVLIAAALLMAPGAAGAAEHESPGDRVTILYDAFGRDDAMHKDWGFAALIEVGGKRILFDTGNDSEVLARNVKGAGVDLRRLDFVILSHRHGDHMGGLNHLLSVNPDVTIYVPQENFGVFGATLSGTFYPRNESLPAEMRYFDGNPPAQLRSGSPWPEANFRPVTAATEVAPGFHLIYSKGTWGVDLELMEVSLAIDTAEGIVLVVGCSHPTIERIVAAAREAIDKPIHLIVGGLHLLPAPDEETRRIARVLQDEHRVGWIAPGHCTGEPAFGILQQAFAERYVYAGLGTKITLGPTPQARGGE